MKNKTFTILFLVALFATVNLQAQRVFIEEFDYPAERPLILNPVAGEANFDDLTGWTTYKNDNAAIETFTMTNAPLTYEGYSDGIGNALYYNGIQGGGVFKPLDSLFTENETFYLAFLVNFQESEADGSEFMMAVKLNPGPSDYNWGARIFAQKDFVTGDFMIGINKLAGGNTEWATEGPFLAPDQTHLFVVKYEIGDVVGESKEEEEGNFDDVMTLYIDPAIGETEPETFTLQHSDPNQSDIRRWGNTAVFGGAHSLYLRAPAEGGVPQYIIDDIRVGYSWNDILPATTSVPVFDATELTHFVRNQRVYISGAEDYSSYSLYSITGQAVLSGSLQAADSGIDVSSLKKGIYIIRLNGSVPAAMKVFVP